jgi:hypothetical protein
MQRPVCCSNGSTGGGDQKTAFPWGHGDPVCEWKEALLCFVESFVPLCEGCTVGFFYILLTVHPEAIVDFQPT